MLRSSPCFPRAPVARATATVTIVLGLLIAGRAAHAGQVRVDVTNFSFTPRVVFANPSDHVVWVWGVGGHSVTSGDSSLGTKDGRFDSAVQNPAGTYKSFSWRISGPSTAR